MTQLKLEEFNRKFENQITFKMTINDFKVIKSVYRGAYAHLILAKKASNQKKYIIKIFDKTKIIEKNLQNSVLLEKKILQSINFSFVMSSYSHFMDECSLYFVLPFAEGGDLLYLLQKYKKFREDVSKFFASQIVLAIEYLHLLKLVHRDLKPENIFLDSTGYIKVGDFGFCKKIEERTYTLCGTPQYLAPEIILCRGYGKSVDWWTFGIFLFELNAGYLPFMGSEEFQLFERIINLDYEMPKFFSPNLADLVDNIIQVDLSKRYGNLRNGIDDIKKHNWFTGINFTAILKHSMPAPIYPDKFSQLQEKVTLKSGPCDSKVIANNFDEF